MVKCGFAVLLGVVCSCCAELRRGAVWNIHDADRVE